MAIFLDFTYWIGKLHPALVHFPIALLITGAVAEAIWLFTDRPIFHAASRFCIWCGAVTAVFGTMTGWLFGGLRLADDDWVLMAHRWLGTATTVWACVVLLASELSCRSVHSRTARVWFRACLFIGIVLVGMTGYFGGALIYGIDHYAW